MQSRLLLSLLIFILPHNAFAQTVGSEKEKTAISSSNPSQIQPTYDPTLSNTAPETTSYAKNTDNNSPISEVYLVLEAGSILNKSQTSGNWSSFTTKNNMGGSFGAALGYRKITPGNFLYGLEISIASSSASSSVTDSNNVRVFDSKQISGLYGTIGYAMGTNRETLIYMLLGIGATKADSITSDLAGNTEGVISEKGNGFSMGAALEHRISEKFGLRFKLLQNFYKQGTIEELRIRDTAFIGGLVITF